MELDASELGCEFGSLSNYASSQGVYQCINIVWQSVPTPRNVGVGAHHDELMLEF